MQIDHRTKSKRDLGQITFLPDLKNNRLFEKFLTKKRKVLQLLTLGKA